MTRTRMPDEYMTTKEAAQELRLAAPTVARYAKQGRIAGAEKAGNRYRIRRAEFRLLPDPMAQSAAPLPTPRLSRPKDAGHLYSPAAPSDGTTLRAKLAEIRSKYRT